MRHHTYRNHGEAIKHSERILQIARSVSSSLTSVETALAAHGEGTCTIILRVDPPSLREDARESVLAAGYDVLSRPGEAYVPGLLNILLHRVEREDVPFKLHPVLASADALVTEFARTLEVLAAAHPEHDDELTELASGVHMARLAWARAHDQS